MISCEDKCESSKGLGELKVLVLYLCRRGDQGVRNFRGRGVCEEEEEEVYRQVVEFASVVSRSPAWVVVPPKTQPILLIKDFLFFFCP